MALAYNHLKLTFGGGIYDQDIWVNSLTFGKEDANVGFETIDYSTLLPDLAADVIAWFTDPDSNIQSAASLKWVKLAYIGADGFYFRDADIFDLETPVTGTATIAGRSEFPPQTTLVQTFTTAVRRGPGRFGRIYPPLNAGGLSNGVVNPSITATQAVKTAKLLGDLRDTLQSSGDLVYPIVASKVGTGINARIRGVSVGNVVDTQRSRRNAFVETYSVTALIPVE